MFGDHIASAMARERQRDLVPELRALEYGRGGFDVEDLQATDARLDNAGAEQYPRLSFRRVRALRITGRRYRRETAEPVAERDDRHAGSAHAEQPRGQRPAVGGELT
jgi:hypothetical protein